MLFLDCSVRFTARLSPVYARYQFKGRPCEFGAARGPAGKDTIVLATTFGVGEVDAGRMGFVLFRYFSYWRTCSASWILVFSASTDGMFVTCECRYGHALKEH